MSFWSEVSLVVIAVATLTMALVQVGVIVCGWVLARRVSTRLTQLEREMKPLADHVNAIARDAARATALAAAQVERVDTLFNDLTAKIEETASTVQKAVITPLRDGAALMAGLRAAIDVFRDLSRSSRPRAGTDEDDPLFIG